MTPFERYRNTYEGKPIDRLFRDEFGMISGTFENWQAQGWDDDWGKFMLDDKSFYFDSIGYTGVNFLGWTDAPIVPFFQEEMIERDEKYEYFRLSTGEVRKYTIGSRYLIMPLFVSAPVESRADWYDVVKPKLDPDTPERWAEFSVPRLLEAKQRYERGEGIFTARFIGAYMYLRSLCGPENVLYLFYDDPELLQDMMRTWLKLTLSCLTRIQKFIPFFELYFGEDIAYKGHPLISPDMFKRFLRPYYEELFEALKNGQKEFMHIHLDSDGDPSALLPLYVESGVTVFSPCEVAAGADPVRIGEEYPDLMLKGGMDKRMFTLGKGAIERELNRVIPVMKRRGRFIPTSDHCVPEDVPYENYLFYRQLLVEMSDY